MKSTLVRQAVQAQYKWHKHVPLMRFVGPRKDVWGKTEVTEPKKVAAAEAINFWELPARYRPLPISAAEIEAIESGGASVL
ncbi:hypothetical protein GGI09_008126 [Coemansia sp. S100]|nr:hypothetical protein GGH13_002984 [Coemansia sp. S155-1]KAJ2077984.1 hypothetical protein GGI09_008126 [Coemansia sp. S100]KAJ2421716.1 hypothetical protein GGF41_003768 [Coemansia sp. RSA 2531]